MKVTSLTSILAMGFAACSSSDAPADGGAVVDAGLGMGAADVLVAIDGGACDNCGAPRFTAECTAPEMACLNDVGCAAIRNCVFGGGNLANACALDATGPACVDACIQQACVGAGSVTLYHALDQCAYCSTCVSSCSEYCSAFTDAGAACPR
jgi:hypothetical protein